MLSFTTRPFRPSDAELYVRLAADAFSIVPSWQRPKDSIEFVAHMHSSANPAGLAIVAIAEQEGREVGHFSAIPARLRTHSGALAIGWQLSCFAIARDLQRQGVGTGLVGSLLDEVAKTPRDFVYVYPNPRSLGVFLRHGGRYLDDAPAWILFPRPFASREGIELIDAAAALRAIEQIPEVETAPGNFLKDRAFFHWRFLGPDADRRTRFARVRRAGTEFVLVLASHRASGIDFTVLVDVYPDILRTHYGLVLAAARAAGGGRPVYLTTNLGGRVDARGAPWRVRVPQRFDPRPVGTMIMPRTELADGELARSQVITGDWMSF
ncbi:MAG: GNAT family N-acetyltransferase [Planctomycetia bacterium]